MRTSLCALAGLSKRLRQLSSLSGDALKIPVHTCETVQKNMTKQYTVAIEGNIGCGKSSMLSHFMSDSAIKTLTEPVSRWTSLPGGFNALKMLYEDPIRWSFMFNYYALLTRLQQHTQKCTTSVKMMERSIFSTRNVFIENSYHMGYLTEMEYSILNEVVDHYSTAYDTHLDLIVYLRASPETCLERVRKRGRKEECEMTLEFLIQLHELYEDWLVRKTRFSVPADVLIIDANHDLSEMHEVYDSHRSKITFDCG